MHDQSSSPSHKNLVLIVNLGTPDTPTYWSTLRYLQEFLSDSRVIEIPKLLWYPILYGFILPFRSFSSSKKYLRVYNPNRGLPLRYLSEDLIEGINAQLTKDSSTLICKLAMRYGNPHIKDIMHTLKDTPIKNLYILPLFPQYSAATTATIMDAISISLKSWRYVPNIQFIHGFWDDEGYISVIAENIRQHWKTNKRSEKLLMSYHGLPQRNLTKGDPYYCLCQKTSRLIAHQLGLEENEYEVVFQSRFGPSQWLQPYTEDRLAALANEGIKTIDIIAPGFVIDCLETDDEIAREYAEIFEEKGGKKLQYISAMNATPASIRFFTGFIKKTCTFMQ